jgi:hypothetical protein
MASQLQKARPFAIGMTGPVAKPAMISGAGFVSGGRATNVALSYGRPLAVKGPLTVIETCFSRADCTLLPLIEVITRAELRDKAWSREDWEAEPGLFSPGPEHVQVDEDGFRHTDRPLVIAGQIRRVPLVSREGYEALRFEYDHLVVTAVARGGFADRPAFDVVADLAPYLSEHRRFIVSWLRFW